MWISNNDIKFWALMSPMFLYLIATFSAMIYLGSCSGKTLLLEKGLAIKMYYGVEKCH